MAGSIACKRSRTIIAHSNSLSISKVIQRSLLVNDTDSSLLSADANALDVVGRLAQLLQLVVEDVGGLDGGLSVELGGEGDFEEDIFHDV